MNISVTFLTENFLQVRLFKKKENIFLYVNMFFLTLIVGIIFSSVFFYPLPISIFLTLVYVAFSYGSLLFFNTLKNNADFVIHCTKTLSVHLPKEYTNVLTLISVFIIILFLFYIVIPTEGLLSDVDDAIKSAVAGFSIGINPYKHSIVPHIFNKQDLAEFSNNLSHNDIYSTYNYLPLDLIFYYIGYKVLAFFAGDNWFYLTNILVFCVCIYIFSRNHSLSKFQSFLLFFPSILFGGLIANDIWLILFYILFLTWLDNFKDKKYDQVYNVGAVTFLTMGFLTKMLLIFILPIFLLYITRRWITRVKYITYSVFLSIIVISLFDINAVISSVFLFHSNLETRGQLAFVGGLLAIPLEYLGLSNWYLPLFVVTYILVLWGAKYYSNTLEGQILFVTSMVILLLPSGNFIPTILAIAFISTYRAVFKVDFTVKSPVYP